MKKVSQILFTLALLLVFGCKSVNEESAAFSANDEEQKFCGTLKENVFTTSPAETKYILEPNDGATTGMLEEFSNNGEEICIRGDFSEEVVQVVSADKINKRFENLCGVVQSPTNSDLEGAFMFIVGEETYILNPGDGAVLGVLGEEIGKNICIKADFTEKEVEVESVANIGSRVDP